jgi:hypothetical protein
MSDFFVKKFKQKHRCKSCRSSKIKANGKVYSLCYNHLTKARKESIKWSEQRRHEGLCISCDRKSFRGWLRCRLHREINRLRIQAWIKAHPEYYREQWKLQKQLRDGGLCPSCHEHRPLSDGYLRCKPCRDRAFERVSS